MFFFFFLRTYILLLGFVLKSFHAPTVSLSAILGESNVRRGNSLVLHKRSQITYNLTILLIGQIYCDKISTFTITYRTNQGYYMLAAKKR